MTIIVAPGNWKGLRELAETHHKAKLTAEVTESYNSIARNMGKGDCGLYCEAANDKGMYAATNALVGMLALLLEENDDAERIYGLINSEIGRDERDGLYRCQVGGSMSYADDSALVGAFACMLGRREEAEDIYGTIKRQIKREGRGRLYTAGSGGSHTDENAAIGILAFLLGRKGEAESLYHSIKSTMAKRDGELYSHGVEDIYGGGRGAYSYDNALMGVLAFLLGWVDEASDLHDSVGTEIGKGPSGLYRNDQIEGVENARSSGSMAILKCLLEGGSL